MYSWWSRKNRMYNPIFGQKLKVSLTSHSNTFNGLLNIGKTLLSCGEREILFVQRRVNQVISASGIAFQPAAVQIIK